MASALMTIPQMLMLGVQHHQAGRLAEAEKLYRQTLAVNPQHPDALHLLGLLAHQVNRSDVAVDLIRRAISVNPANEAYHLNLGNALRATGRLDDAIACYRKAVALSPKFLDAHGNLGSALATKGQIDEAIACCQQMLAIKPDLAEAHYNLGNLLHTQNRSAEAVACYEKALALRPDFVEAQNNLGNVLGAMGQLERAIACFEQVVALRPALPEPLYNLARILGQCGRVDESIARYRQVLALKHDYPEAHNNLGNALRDKGQLDQAIACYQRAVAIKPDYPDAYANMGNVLLGKGDFAQASACYRQALALKPDLAEGHYNLGIALTACGQPDEAIASYERALALKPDYAEALNNMGLALLSKGQLDQAVESFGRASELKPDDATIYSNVVYTLHFHSAYDPQTLYQKHRDWNAQYAAPLASLMRPHLNDRDPARRLRVGYVSPDLRDHVVARFLLPLLRCHDHANFEIYCYAHVQRPDAMTDQLRAQADQWRSIVGLSDEQAAEMIRQDQIDILVDLSLHMAMNRLLIFARKPAPVQLTYLAYCSTSGMDTMDYRLTDPYLDPPGMDERVYSERSIRLPETYWCYQASEPTPEVGALPAASAGHITFGCLNNFCKVSEPALKAWGEILRAVPESALLLHAQEGSHRQRVLDQLKEQGVEAARVRFVGSVPMKEYFRLYQGMDIALDPFPYCGGTTTCDALWMGIPVVTLSGRTAVGRGGVSLLTNVGLRALVAGSEEEYVKLAVGLAHDRQRLAELRSSLRDRMRGSPLMDAPRFARNVEAAYRTMWRQWCAAGAG